MTALVTDTLFLLNLAVGGAGPVGGDGGNGLGGGVFNGGPSPFGASDLTLLRALVEFNEADGGAAGGAAATARASAAAFITWERSTSR